MAGSEQREGSASQEVGVFTGLHRVLGYGYLLFMSSSVFHVASDDVWLAHKPLAEEYFCFAVV